MIEAVDLVDEQHVAVVEVGQNRGKIARALDRGAARELDLRAHRVCDDVRERRLTQPGRAIEKDVIERLAARFCRLHVDGKILFDFVLPDVLCKRLGAQDIFLRVQFALGARKQSLFAEFVHVTFLSTPPR